MKYQALYRKYRPKNFNEIAGQKTTVKILKNAIINNHVSHAYLFYGPRGTGKTSIAKIFARTINCENSVDAIPCEKCDSCLYSKEFECPDIIEIDAASNNGVEEIRELKNKISFIPTELKYKVYIIDEVHMLSTGAFNALLKTLEEPPDHAIFILATTELQKVPLTIISRCQTMEFKKIDDESIKIKLQEIANNEKIKIDETAIKEIIKNSNGGLRDAIGLLEKANSFSKSITGNVIREISGNLSDEELKSFISLLDSKKMEDVLNKISNYYDSGIDLIKLGNSIINYLRDDIIVNKKYNSEYCNYILKIDDALRKMEKSENPKIIFEITMMSLLNNNQDLNDNIITNNEVKQNIEQNIEQKNNFVDSNNSISENNELKEIRVGNTLYNPQKSIISNIRNNWNSIKDLAFDEKFGNIARTLSSDVLPVAASDTNVILISKLDGISNQINNNLDLVEKIIKLKFNNDYKVICLSKDEWDKYTIEYKNNKDKFKFIKENNIEKNNKKTLKEKANELFN